MRFVYARTNAYDVTFIVDDKTKQVLYQSETRHFPIFNMINGLEDHDRKTITKKIAKKYLKDIEETSVFEKMHYSKFENYFTEGVDIITECKRRFNVPEMEYSGYHCCY